MRIAVMDLETTGLEQAKGHRIIEVALQHAEIALNGDVQKLHHNVWRINPQRTIDPDAQAVHKIAASDLAGEPVWGDVASTINAALTGVDLLVAHNMDFDGPFYAAEVMRVGLSPPPMQVFCTMMNARWATGTGKLPRLGELAWSLGVEYDPSKAHGAMYDVSVTLECLARGMARGFYTLPAVGAP